MDFLALLFGGFIGFCLGVSVGVAGLLIFSSVGASSELREAKEKLRSRKVELQEAAIREINAQTEAVKKEAGKLLEESQGLRDRFPWLTAQMEEAKKNKSSRLSYTREELLAQRNKGPVTSDNLPQRLAEVLESSMPDKIPPAAAVDQPGVQHYTWSMDWVEKRATTTAAADPSSPRKESI